MNTLFVVNPIAGGKDKKALLKTIKSWAESSAIEMEIWETSGKNDVENLKEILDENPPKQLIAVGGDGTVLLCASVLHKINSQIPLGILPAGSANGMGTEIGMPNNVSEALENFLNPTTTDCDLLLFNDRELGMHISDIGLNAKLVKNFEEGERRGFLGYAQGVIGELIDVKPFQATIHTASEKIEKECYMVAFANARRYGTGALLNNIGKINDGKFEVSLLVSLDMTGIAGQFFDIISEDSDHIKTYQCTELKLKANRKLPFQIDGELQEDTDELSVRIVPAAIRLILPAKED